LGDGADTSPFDLERIKMPTGGETKWPGAGETFDGIIVAWRACRAYWPGEFSGAEPPACSSPDGKRGFGEPGGECQDCPFSAWKSAKDGRGQACKAMRRLLILGAGDWLPRLLTLPPTSIKASRLYMTSLARQGRIYYSVVTEFGLKPEKNPKGIAYASVTFAEKERLGEDQMEVVRAYHDSIDQILDAMPVVTDDYAVEL
jgi:hypothetical protein